MMKTFGEYISFWSVTDVLISKRVQLCDRRHKKHQVHLLSPKLGICKLTETDATILAMMPPRRSWISLSRKTRYKDLQDGHRQRETAARCNWKSIKWTILRDSSNDEKPPYWVNLQHFVENIQARVQDKAFALNAPELFPDIKDESSCRPLCKFVNLEDSVILILANKYLTELFDGLFYEESLAFRSKRIYHGQEKYVTAHHDAIARIKEYRNRFDSKKLYVSECDLQKFYDTVSHSVVRKCYYSLMKEIERKNPSVRFDEINRVFEAYMQCYCFPRDVYPLNDKPEFWEEAGIMDLNQRRFKWAEKDMLKNGLAKSMRGLLRMNVGVPQGGALSGLIANMVLNTVDWQVKKKMTDSDIYLRYCDDMIIISTSKIRCQRLFATYYNGTKKLKLVPHRPEKDLKFGQEAFWKGKSKEAYLWDIGRNDAAEWIGFVGYEMKRNGWIRIRKRSLKNELKKQKEVVFDKVLDKIKGKDRVSDDSLLSSLESKLISMSVGKISVWNAEFMESEMCWSAGFRELEMNPVLSRQLHELDRHRGMILNEAARCIDGMTKKRNRVERKDLKQEEEEKFPDSRGMVHSYYYQFAKKKQ